MNTIYNTKIKIIDIQDITEDAKLILFEKPVGFKNYFPGQHVVIELNIKNVILKRVYSLTSIPSESTLSIIVKTVKNGIVSNYINNSLAIGDNVNLTQVYGSNYFDNIKNEKLLLLAAGSGITPFISLIKQWQYIGCPKEIILMQSAKKKLQLIYDDFFEKLKENNLLFKYAAFTTQEKERSRISFKHLEQAVSDIHERVIICCGPESFVTDCLTWLNQLNVNPKNIYQEIFLTDNVIIDEKDFYKITLLKQNKNFNCPKNFTVLKAADKNNILIPSGCKAGQCGVCKLKLISGKTRYLFQTKFLNKINESKEILSCCAIPLCDLIVDY